MRPSSPKRCVSLGSLKNRKRVFFSEKKRWFFRARFRVSKPPKRDGWVFLSRLWVLVGHAGFSNQKKEAILHSNFTHLWTLTGDLYISLLCFTICVKMTWRWKSCYHIIHNVSIASRLVLLHRWSLQRIFFVHSRMKRRSVEGQLWRLLQQVVFCKGWWWVQGSERSRAQHLAKLAAKDLFGWTQHSKLILFPGKSPQFWCISLWHVVLHIPIFCVVELVILDFQRV